jgi:hypothetical protein
MYIQHQVYAIQVLWLLASKQPQNLHCVWWWTKRPSETCRLLFQNKINLRYCASGWFYYRNILRYTVLQTSNVSKNLSHKAYKCKWSIFYFAATWQAKDAFHSNCHSHLNKATSGQIMSTVQIWRRLFQTVTTLTATYYRTKHKYRLMSSSYINLSLTFSRIRLFSTS